MSRADNLRIDRFRQARRDPALVALDGLHPVKHARRFGAELLEAVSPHPDALLRLASELAPDTVETLRELVQPVSAADFAQMSPKPPDTGLIAIARRPAVNLAEMLQPPTNPGNLWRPTPLEYGGAPAAGRPVVVLDNPRNPFNIGAAVRVAAAAGAAGLLCLGPQDPWHPAAVVSGVGLQFALPVGRADTLPHGGRPLLIIDPAGEPMPWGEMPPGAALVFGNERRGVGPELLARAHRRLSIPMTPGVSSLNLATSAAIALYALAPPGGGRPA